MMEIREEIIIENIKKEKDINNNSYYDNKILNYYEQFEDLKHKFEIS